MADTEDKAPAEAKPRGAKLEKAAAPAKRTAPKSARHIVSGGVVDQVRVSRLGPGTNKSLSVHHVQRRLTEWGYADVYRDRDAFWREGTTDALDAFKRDEKLEDFELRDVLARLFENDANVEVVD